MPNARNSELGKAKEMILVYTTPYLISGWRGEWYTVLRRNVAERLTLGVAVFKQEEATLIKNGAFWLWGGLGRKSPSTEKQKL